MSDYVQIKASDLKEGQRFWKYPGSVGNTETEMMKKNGILVFAKDKTLLGVGAVSQYETVYAKSIINTGDTMSLQDKLAALKKLQSHNEKSREGMANSYRKRTFEIIELEKQIADAEVTYSIGDRFKNKQANEGILAKIYNNKQPEVTFVCLCHGTSYGAKSFPVKDFSRITPSELARILFGNTEFIIRIWDNRKQEKVSE
jgi:hypothetical protein